MNTRLFIVALLTALMMGCATTQQGQASTEKSVDPYEGFNRTMYGFNDGLDRYFLKPVAQSYHFVTPDFFEDGISNFFSNLLELRSAFNSVLQGKGGKVVHYTGRFLVNSTVGIGGLFDAANPMGIEKIEGEDFGQTLGAWGVESGPYLVLPLFGPSNLRDSVSMPVDIYTDPVTYLESSHARHGLDFLDLVDDRAKLLETEKLISGDRYIFIRNAYLQRREYLINDGEVEDTFGTDADGDF